MSTRPLNPRQEAFARQYLVDLDAANAARRAGYSTRTAKQSGYDLLQDERIQALVTAEMGKRAERVKDSMDEVVRDLRRIGHLAEVRRDLGTAVRTIELRGKHLGMFKDRIALGGDEGAPPIEHNLTVTFIAAKR